MKRTYSTEGTDRTMTAQCFAGHSGLLVYQFPGEAAVETETFIVACKVLKKPSIDVSEPQFSTAPETFVEAFGNHIFAYKHHSFQHTMLMQYTHSRERLNLFKTSYFRESWLLLEP